jgi:hypothetical protein
VDKTILNCCVFIDIVKGALLRRMAREVTIVLTDNFLKPEQRAKTVTLYERVGDNFVTYIKRSKVFICLGRKCC